MTQREDDVAAGENAAYASERRIAEKERANNGNGLFSYLRPSALPPSLLLLLSVRARAALRVNNGGSDFVAAH